MFGDFASDAVLFWCAMLAIGQCAECATTSGLYAFHDEDYRAAHPVEWLSLKVIASEWMLKTNSLFWPMRTNDRVYSLSGPMALPERTAFQCKCITCKQFIFEKTRTEFMTEHEAKYPGSNYAHHIFRCVCSGFGYIDISEGPFWEMPACVKQLNNNNT